MVRRIVKRIFGVTWICLGVVYPFYCWVAQAGLYSWFIDLELMFEGKGPYTIHANLLMIPTVLISWVTVYVLYRFFDSIIDRLLPPPAAMLGEAPETAPKPMNDGPVPAP